MEFLLNIASSVYFAFGASIILVVCLIFIIIPMMNRIKQLDDIVQTKLKLLPTSKFYSQILDEFLQQRITEEAAVKEFERLKKDIDEFRQELMKIDISQLSDEFLKVIEDKTNFVLHEFADLEKSLVKFTRSIRDNEKRSEVQLCNLVAAQIDLIVVFITILKELHNKNMALGVNEDDLRSIKNNLQNGYDSVKKNGNYRALGSNSRSGDFDKFIDDDF